MEFLVRIEWEYPEGWTSEKIAELMTAEEERGLELIREGVIKHFWRLPGKRANVGIWEAEDAAELNKAIWSLPWFPWFHAEVTVLAKHYLT